MSLDNFLIHHGIKGQKWGVRRFQNPDGSLTSEGRKRYDDQIIKKGTNLYRVSDATEKNLHDGFYVSVDQNDRDKYLNTYAKQMLNNGRKVIEKTLSANNDIKIPNHKKSIELMKEALDSSNIGTDTKRFNALKQYFNNDISNENNSSDKLYRKAIKELDKYSNTGKVGDNLYDAINIAQADRRSSIVQDISNNFYDTLNKHGYGAVVDLNDYKYGSMKTNNPLIITNAGNVSISQIRQIEHIGIIGNFLMHHGIKGQKWGVRRFQNLDGTLTKAGKQHAVEQRNIVRNKPYTDDVNDIVNTLSKKEKEFLGAPSKGDWIDKNHENDTLKEKAVTFIAKHGDTPISFVEVWTNGGKTGQIALATRNDSKYRGKGYASKNVEDAIKWCERYGSKSINELEWIADRRNVASVNLGKKYGFTEDNPNKHGHNWTDDWSRDYAIMYRPVKQRR